MRRTLLAQREEGRRRNKGHCTPGRICERNGREETEAINRREDVGRREGEMK